MVTIDKKIDDMTNEDMLNIFKIFSKSYNVGGLSSDLTYFENGALFDLKEKGNLDYTIQFMDYQLFVEAKDNSLKIWCRPFANLSLPASTRIFENKLIEYFSK